MIKHRRSILCCIILVLGLVLIGCTSETTDPGVMMNTDFKKGVDDPVFRQMERPSLYDFRQYEGVQLNFLVENNLFANILESEIESFYEVTGIRVKIHAMDFDTLFQKMNLDFISKTGKYQIVYVDPYKTLNRFSGYLADLNTYQLSSEYPHVKGFPDDFFRNQVLVTSYFQKTDHLYAIPFDNTTMILYYRKDIFEKYKDLFYKAKGYDWTPGSEGFTWERYIEIAHWIDTHVPDDEVAYGSGHMAWDHNSIFCDFSNVMAAYGADYFETRPLSTLGNTGYNEIKTNAPEFIKALTVYKDVLKASDPESVEWDWTDSAGAFRDGKIAMMPNWDENYSQIEYGEASKVSGKVGYALLPSGSVRSADIFGGSGIGINKFSNQEERDAAWLFVVWATSKEMQEKLRSRPEGGMPTRKSLYQDVYKKPSDFPAYAPVVLDAWKDENAYFRPKMTYSYEFEKILTPKLHKMIEMDLEPVEVAEDITEALKELKQLKEGADQWNP